MCARARSGSAQACSPSAQVKAAAAHVQTESAKKILSMSIEVSKEIKMLLPSRNKLRVTVTEVQSLALGNLIRLGWCKRWHAELLRW
jgi:hypothetical protein